MNVEKCKDRNLELDTIKFFAIFLIYTTHFITRFKPEVFDLWQIFPTNILLKGLTGKCGVAFFGVLLGYFAFAGGKKKPLLEYSLKRYGYFVFVGLFINTIYCVWRDISFSELLPVSFGLGADIFPTYWCIKEFLFASIIAYYMGRSKWNFEAKLFIIFLLFLVGQFWIPICLFGTLIPEVVESTLFKHKFISYLLLLVSFISIKRPGGPVTYTLDAIFALVVICVIENSCVAKKLLSNKILASLGKRTMAILVIHPITYNIVGNWLFDHVLTNAGIGFVLAWLLCFLIVCVLSYPVTWFFDLYNKAFEIVVTFCKKKLMLEIQK